MEFRYEPDIEVVDDAGKTVAAFEVKARSSTDVKWADGLARNLFEGSEMPPYFVVVSRDNIYAMQRGAETQASATEDILGPYARRSGTLVSAAGEETLKLIVWQWLLDITDPVHGSSQEAKRFPRLARDLAGLRVREPLSA